jgi:hypothetical protein
VKRTDAKLTVQYDGAAQFKPIEGTNLEYAINTSTDVIHAEGRYYALQGGIWFVSSSPPGPWVLADTIPAAIYSIPSSSPLYHVRFVYVYGWTPDYVEFGYTPDYLGAFVSETAGWFSVRRPLLRMALDLGLRLPVRILDGWLVLAARRRLLVYHNPPNVHRIFSGHRNTHWSPNDPERIRGDANVYSDGHLRR